MHQWRALTKDRGLPDVDPRRQHIQDLIGLLQEDNANGVLPLLIGDFNEDFKDEEQDGIKLLLSTAI